MQNPNYKIPRSQILRLYESSLREISPHSIGQWLKVQTNSQYIVLPIAVIEELPDKLQQSFQEWL